MEVEGGGRIWKEKMKVEGGYGGRRWKWREKMVVEGGGRIWREKMEVEGIQSPYSPSTSIFSLHILGEDGGYGGGRGKERFEG